MILHICPRDVWAEAVAAGALVSEPFLHCSAPDQVHIPATMLFRGRTDLLLLEIDESLLPVPVTWEQGDPPHPDGRLFPHLYAALPVEAVTAVRDYRPEPDGTFAPLAA